MPSVFSFTSGVRTHLMTFSFFYSCLSLSVCSTAPPLALARVGWLHCPSSVCKLAKRVPRRLRLLLLFVLSVPFLLRFSLFIRQSLALRFSARPLLYAPSSLHLILPVRPPTHLLFCARFRPFTPQRSDTGSWFCTGEQCAALMPFCATYGTEPHQRRLQTASLVRVAVSNR